LADVDAFSPPIGSCANADAKASRDGPRSCVASAAHQSGKPIDITKLTSFRFVMSVANVDWEQLRLGPIASGCSWV
jgi:hypothetical protein